MADSKNLYFIPIIARALQSDDPRQAMEEAFDEIKDLGKQAEYKEGLQQFMDFVKTSFDPSDQISEQKMELIRNALYRLIYDLSTGTYDGDEKQEEDLLATLKKNPEWNAEYERIKEEAQALILTEKPLELEFSREDQVIGSYPVSPDPTYIRSITPGKYRIRFSNGRLLWEGNLKKKDLIWASAFPEKELEMAAETEMTQRRPTRTIHLLDGEITLSVFAGLESGQIRIRSGKNK